MIKMKIKMMQLLKFIKCLRPGEPPTLEIATQIFNNLFFSSDRYDFLMLEELK